REPFHEVARVVLRYLRWSMRLPPCWDIGIPVITAIRKMSVFIVFGQYIVKDYYLATLHTFFAAAFY
ncbi:hypothetical protein, partial [Lactobacillus delbrueckii]|uniref:hypothetical protein n=1 Tax=Lactobacillus delbrueckii TaxID=1584 RepID=UPI0021A934EF